ncbi:hypothetical protein J7400_04630 [Shimia sp. R9_2]|uniref:hypothetical protein n=1 Tax=Shimia sp. R9_2 TaxID=2821112 RepID=UPI001ADA7523|nr:hypothetical protein [Shimia sp. R9_2]MBO9395955.1 hypothetical protein [Shimia sp. R9_2]
MRFVSMLVNVGIGASAVWQGSKAREERSLLGMSDCPITQMPQGEKLTKSLILRHGAETFQRRLKVNSVLLFGTG